VRKGDFNQKPLGFYLTVPSTVSISSSEKRGF